MDVLDNSGKGILRKCQVDSTATPYECHMFGTTMPRPKSVQGPFILRPSFDYDSIILRSLKRGNRVLKPDNAWIEKGGYLTRNIDLGLKNCDDIKPGNISQFASIFAVIPF